MVRTVKIGAEVAHARPICSSALLEKWKSLEEKSSRGKMGCRSRSSRLVLLPNRTRLI